MQSGKGKLAAMVSDSDKIIYRVEQAFPFNIFPDSITVDKNKIDIVYRHFLWQKEIFTILIEDLTTIKVTTGPIYAMVFFEVRGYERNPEPVEYLSKTDAITLREYVLGLAKAAKERAPLEKLTKKSMRTLRKVGTSQENLTAAV